LKLYVTGMTPTARNLVDRLRAILEEAIEDHYDLEVLDVLEHPESAYDDMILATPTLIRSLPPPVRKLVGDLSDQERVLAGLEIFGTGNRAEKDG
ncbi:MAG: circadian clock KaiB family protein, partial [Pseudomonadota bacterium]